MLIRSYVSAQRLGLGLYACDRISLPEHCCFRSDKRTIRNDNELKDKAAIDELCVVENMRNGKEGFSALS